MTTVTRVHLKQPLNRAKLYSVLKDSDPECGLPQWSKENPSGCKSPFHPKHHVSLGYIPTEKQREILEDSHLSLLVYGGYRGGKSAVASIKGFSLTIQFFSDYYNRAGGQVAWLVGSNYEKVRGEFNYLFEHFSKLFPGQVKQSNTINPGTIRIPTPCPNHPPSSGLCTRECRSGGVFTIKTKSAEDPSSISAEAPVWIILAEAAHVSSEIYQRLSSRVSEARSRFPGYGMLMLEGTADTLDASLGWYAHLWKQGQQHEYQEARNFKSFSLPSSSNTFLYPGGEDDPELLARRAELTPERYSEWHLGVPVPPSGRVFTEFDPLIHLQRWRYDPDLPVYVGIDPGYSGQPSRYAVEACQKDAKGQWHAFDEIYVQHMTTVNVVEAAQQRYWWKNPDRTFVIDVAATAHAGAMEPSEQIWREKAHINLGHQKVAIMPGIDRFASMLRINPITQVPNMTIDPITCPGLVAELGGGLDPISREPRVYSWMKNSQGETVGRTPHDRYCDAIKAVTYLMIAVIGYVDEKHVSKITKVVRMRDRRL